VALGDDDAEDYTTKKTLAETTALLDRDKLLARIEQFQRTKEGKETDKPEPVARAVPTAPRALPAEAPPASGDPVIARAAALRSADVAIVKAALAPPLTASFTALAIPLLANDAVVRDAVRALRKIAPKATGQLLDALLDPEVDARVRRRLPRVLKVCRTQRAAAGLALALRDPVFEVRAQVGLALAQMQDEAHVTMERDELFAVAVHELTAGRASWQDTLTAPADDALRRGLAHVFIVLGLVLEREPLSIAYRAIRSDDHGLRGTAHEYLEVVLPATVRDVLMPLLGNVKPSPRGRDRDTKELADELLRSSASISRPVGG
jgi:hypothetical protein